MFRAGLHGHPTSVRYSLAGDLLTPATEGDRDPLKRIVCRMTLPRFGGHIVSKLNEVSNGKEAPYLHGRIQG